MLLQRRGIHIKGRPEAQKSKRKHSCYSFVSSSSSVRQGGGWAIWLGWGERTARRILMGLALALAHYIYRWCGQGAFLSFLHHHQEARTVRLCKFFAFSFELIYSFVVDFAADSEQFVWQAVYWNSHIYQCEVILASIIYNFCSNKWTS